MYVNLQQEPFAETPSACHLLIKPCILAREAEQLLGCQYRGTQFTTGFTYTVGNTCPSGPDLQKHWRYLKDSIHAVRLTHCLPGTKDVRQ